MAVDCPAYAHHSAAATYLFSRQVTIKGVVAQLLYRNPHSFLKVDVKDSEGQVVRWSAEWGSVGELTTTRVTRDSLKAGDQVEVTGNPGRNEREHVLRITKVVRASDGWEWQGK
jgi:hypothetical protein